MTRAQPWRIGKSMIQVCLALALTPRAVRFYEQRGLVSPDRDSHGRRLYSAEAFARLEVIAEARRANLSLDASLGASWRDYASTADHDLTLRGETSLTWWLNRYAGLTGRYRYEQLTSTLPDRDTEVHNVFLGVKLQR